ncbi:MAG: amidophosphoribosyltransferase [Candidatus Saccharicenans sp.]|nr:amidophosphoribosyltransferase [Candidatus Saccharicenans sp.]MDI6848213.1 amidophosphoribosyltransferase [Candidatus Saccharicenans sp.]
MCGVIGLWANREVFHDLYQGLLSIQHRGQDAAGIITYDGKFHEKKGNGLVLDIFGPQEAAQLKGMVGIGHTRYPTIGGGGHEDAQPFMVNTPFGIILAHNGNVVNYRQLKKELFEKNQRLLNSDCDAEVILNVFAQELEEQRVKQLGPENIFKAVAGVYRRVKGSYSVVAYIAEQGMVAFRDPHGIKPLSFGRRKDGLAPSYAFASETVSLNLMNFEDIEHLQAGEAVFLDRHRQLHRQKIIHKKHTPCLFEWVYFARPDSVIDGVNVYKSRVNLGRLLAAEIKKKNLEIDVVVPVPDSARDAAIEIARRLKLKYREALVKNRYIGRTFIMPAEIKRQSSVRQKLNPICSEIAGKKVLLVDDSIVRGNTSRAIVEMVRECGAEKVYFASYSPPLRYPCVYGIDMQTKTEFVAREADEELVARRIGADRVIYQTLKNLKRAVRMENPELRSFCAACFDGCYPTGDVTQDILKAIEEERKLIQESQLELNIKAGR